MVLALGRWGSHAPFPRGDAALSPDAMMLALPTVFDPERADGLDATHEVRLGEHFFQARVTGGKLELSRGPADDPAAVIATDTVTLPELLWRDRTLEDAERAGNLAIDGSRRAARRFLGLFSAPVGPRHEPCLRNT